MEKGTILKDTSYTYNLCYNILTSDPTSMGYAQCAWLMISTLNGTVTNFQEGVIDVNKPNLIVISQPDMMLEITEIGRKVKAQNER